MSDENLKRAMRISYVLSGTMAFLAGAAFFAVTSLTGSNSALTRFGGAAWVLLLSLIIAMPTVTSAMKRRFRGS